MEAINALVPPILNSRQAKILNETQEYLKCIGVCQKKLRGFLHLAAGQAETFELKKLIEEALLTVRRQANEKDLTLTLDESVKETFIKCNFLNFTRILDNLLTNAVNYTPKRGKVTVFLEASKNLAGELTTNIKVADTGIGMSPEVLQKLFTPFYRASAAVAQNEGTGIGLSSSLNLAKHGMKGGITVESKEGQGSVFTFTSNTLQPTAEEIAALLEADRKAAITPPVSPTLPSSQPLPKPLQGQTILVADDSNINTKILKRILEGAGAKVTLAENGKKAIEEHKLSLFGIR